MIDLIQLSNTDPLWVTIVLIAANSVTFCVVSVWIGVVVRGQLRAVGRVSWPLTWPWALIGWMIAVAVQLVINVSRVLIVRHVRTGDEIGHYFRALEIASTVHLGCWSIVAFWRWAHPVQSVSDEGIFASLAASMPMIVSDATGTIVYVTPAFNGLAGYAGDELIGANLDTIIPAHLRDAHQSGMRRFLSTRESQIIGQVLPLDLLRKDGTELPIYLALATTDVDGQPWFCGSVWRQTGAIECQQSARGEQQDAREDGLDVRAKQADVRSKLQDERSEEQSKESLRLDELRLNGDVSDVIVKTAVDVEEVKQDVQAVKRKIVEGDTP